MTHWRRAHFFGLVGLLLLVAGCAPSSEGETSAVSDAAAALNESGALAQLAARASKGASDAGNGTAPRFVVDPGWPKPLPNNWRISQVGGISVDSHDNIWVYHRPRALESSAAGALPRVGTNARGVPVSGLGHPRPYADRSAACCSPAPSVLKFDRDGDLLDAWGGPSDPGFLENNCREQDGCYWPGREHGIFVDRDDNVYIAGNGQDGGARQQQGMDTYPWAPSFGDDSHILKFTADGTFIFQIGYAGAKGPDSENIDGGPNGTAQPYLPADMWVDPTTNLLYVADGYGNRRVLIVDAATGKHVGHFGAYGQNPVADDPSAGVADADVGPWAADYVAGNMKPMFFRSPMHCAIVSNDELLYACDRGNNRVQIFDVTKVGGPCRNPNAEVGVCGFAGEIHVAPQTTAGTSGAAALSTDPGQTCLYVGDLTNGQIYVINRSNLQELDRIGRSGRQAGEFHWLHTMAVDSQGNIYTGEVDTGQRIQKLLRFGPTGCSGTGNPQVGQYQ
jgi:DNA-binding beta-propeller fold protein YncE